MEDVGTFDLVARVTHQVKMMDASGNINVNPQDRGHNVIVFEVWL